MTNNGNPTSFVPCDNCGKEWPLESLIYLELPTGETTNLCCWSCVKKYSENQIKED